jgi:hypothetical protein
MPYQITVPAKTEPSRHPTYHLSYKLMPEVWYENGIKLRLAYVPVALVLLALTLPQFGWNPPLAWSVVGSFAYAIGWIVDTTSTWLCLRLVSLFEARGLPYPIIETNPFLGAQPSLTEQIFNVTTLFAIFALIISGLFPGAGIAGGILQIGVGINNLRQRKRLQLQLSLYDEVEKSRGV